MPAAAKSFTEAGAEAFLRHYVASVNYAWTTPDYYTLQDLYEPICRVCRNLQATAEKLVADRHRMRAPSLRIESTEISGPAQAGILNVVVRGEHVANQRIDGTGSTVARVSSRPFVWSMYVSWMGDRWNVWDILEVS